MAQRKKFLLRISPELFEELHAWAAREFRSVNGQIEFLLQRAVDERRRGSRKVRRGKPKASEVESDCGSCQPESHS